MGPLAGVRVLELAGLGPGPLAGQFLADLGAVVTVVERPGGGAAAWPGGAGPSLLNRGKRSIVLDLKAPEGPALVLRLASRADALIEGFRPGVMERLGLGPAECARVNPRLVYGRVTGWGQDGPLAQAPGHDLNYVALSGLLSHSSRGGAAPTVPPTVVGDGIGALALAFGIVCALLEARGSGRGQVVDAAMVDAAAAVGGLLHWLAAGHGAGSAGPALLEGEAPFYDVYRCADGRFLSVAALEPPFYRNLLAALELDGVAPDEQYLQAGWPALRTRLTALLASRSRDEWCRRLEGRQACVAPVLDVEEAAGHPHLVARGTYRRTAGALQAAPAPRFSRSAAPPPPAAEPPGAATDAILGELGLGAEEIARLRTRGVVA